MDRSDIIPFPFKSNNSKIATYPFAYEAFKRACQRLSSFLQ